MLCVRERDEMIETVAKLVWPRPTRVIAHGVGEIGWLTAWVVIQPLYENAPDIST